MPQCWVRTGKNRLRNIWRALRCPTLIRWSIKVYSIMIWVAFQLSLSLIFENNVLAYTAANSLTLSANSITPFGERSMFNVHCLFVELKKEEKSSFNKWVIPFSDAGEILGSVLREHLLDQFKYHQQSYGKWKKGLPYVSFQSWCPSISGSLWIWSWSTRREETVIRMLLSQVYTSDTMSLASNQNASMRQSA